MLFERPKSGESAILVHVDLAAKANSDQLQEFTELVLSAGGVPVEQLAFSRAAPHAKFFVGAGKVDEIKQLVQHHQAQLVIFNHALSPGQQRNLERELQCRVLDRTGLILDIFAQRARTHEGKLQVELAQLEHQSTRLIRGWTHLERQKGGIGLRGPGETQLETDRRLIRLRMSAVRRRLERVHSQREQGRRARRRSATQTLSLVGYTNAGKSTLFNSLTQSEVYAADKLFATLDPTLRQLSLPGSGPVVLADTVGFIRDLPHGLVNAFRATLQETVQADLLLLVVDAAETNRDDSLAEVRSVLHEIGADQIPYLLVYNKVDLLADASPRIDRTEAGKPYRVWLSAGNGIGLDFLYEAVNELLNDDMMHQTIRLSPVQGQLRARLYARGAVLQESVQQDGLQQLELRLPKEDFIRLARQSGVDPMPLLSSLPN